MSNQPGVSRARTIFVAVAVASTSIAVPATAAAQSNPVNDLVKGVNGIVNGAVGGVTGAGGAAPAGGAAATADQGAAPENRAGIPPAQYQPPLHGSNPHGQGTVGVVDLNPSDTTPLSGDPATGDEEIVIGDSDGGQDAAGNYNGRVTILGLNLLGLVNTYNGSIPGTNLLNVQTSEGQTNNGPLGPIQGAIDSVCTAPALNQGAGCVTVGGVNSTTGANSSSNSFTLAATNLNIAGLGLNVGSGQSNGSIEENSTCQTSTGSSSVLSANVLTGLLTTGLLESSSRSQACNDGTSSQTNTSNVATVNNVALLSILQPGCGTPGTPDTSLVSLPPLAGVLCSPDDSNGVGEPSSQATPPYGVREALTAFAVNLPILGLTPVKAALSGPESRAVAPALPTTPTTPTQAPGGGNAPGSGGGNPGTGGPNADGPGDGDSTVPVANTTGDPGGQLAFTGSNLLLLALIGGSLLLAGIALAATAGRHRRAVA